MSSKYESPLASRYASVKMQTLFSSDYKFSTWRKLWYLLAETEKELGLPITKEQLEELFVHMNTINYEVAQKKEQEIRHDVMAHVYAYGIQCPRAKSILHLGATSAYVVDNTDLIILKEALISIKEKLSSTIHMVADFAKKNATLITLAYTHFQAAQPTTLGKRATLWLQDLVMDLDQIDFALSQLRLLGCRGAVGTAASFLELFDGDETKVMELETRIVQKLGFDSAYPVSSQTYPRKVDFHVISCLSSIAQSAHKFSNDIRLLMHLKEVDEPFEAEQVGSSAMAYKRNPMRSERIASLARYVMLDALNPAITASNQWLERTLDDSANKRIAIPEAFLGVDAILSLYQSIIQGLVIYPAMMKQHLNEELPFLATENILMHCVKKGGDRQVLHEAIRQHAFAAAQQVKKRGKKNDLLKRILADPRFGLQKEELKDLINEKKFIGLAVEQTRKYVGFIKKQVKKPISSENTEVKV